jgi:hypothetical protein
VHSKLKLVKLLCDPHERMSDLVQIYVERSISDGLGICELVLEFALKPIEKTVTVTAFVIPYAMRIVYSCHGHHFMHLPCYSYASEISAIKIVFEGINACVMSLMTVGRLI